MPRYIDADKLVYQIERKIPSYTGGNDNFVRGFKDALLRFKSMVHSAKTADVQEVRHGKWKWYSDMVDVRCDLCGRFANQATDYCPNCGAKMDAEEGDE